MTYLNGTTWKRNWMSNIACMKAAVSLPLGRPVFPTCIMAACFSSAFPMTSFMSFQDFHGSLAFALGSPSTDKTLAVFVTLKACDRITR